MDFRLPKGEVLNLISYNNAYREPIPVIVNFYSDTGEFLYCDKRYIYIDPWDEIICMNDEKFKYFITDNTYNCSESIVYLDKRA